MSLDQEETLFKLLFSGLSDEKFIETWADEIGPPEDEVCLATYAWKLPKYGRSQVFVFASRMAAVCNAKNKWSAFATKAWVDEREYTARWADFIRGTWVDRVPQEPGVYPTRDREGFRGRDRTFIRKEGRLVDTTVGGGFVGYGKVTEWQGQFWSDSYPPLKGAI